MDDRPVIPATAPLLAAALVAMGLAAATTCIARPVHRGCAGYDLVWVFWDPIIRRVTNASSLPVWSWFREDGPLVFLVAAGPLATTMLGLLAFVVMIAWARHHPRDDGPLAELAPLLLFGALSCVGLGLWGTLLFVSSH